MALKKNNLPEVSDHDKFVKLLSESDFVPPKEVMWVLDHAISIQRTVEQRTYHQKGSRPNDALREVVNIMAADLGEKAVEEGLIPEPIMTDRRDEEASYELDIFMVMMNLQDVHKFMRMIWNAGIDRADRQHRDEMASEAVGEKRLQYLVELIILFLREHTALHYHLVEEEGEHITEKLYEYLEEHLQQ